MYSIVYAQINWNNLVTQTAPNLAGKDLAALIGGQGRFPGLALFIFFISGFALVLYLLYGGFILLTSGGDPRKIDSGKQTLTNAIVGIIIVATAYWIVQILGLVLGLGGFGGVF